MYVTTLRPWASQLSERQLLYHVMFIFIKLAAVILAKSRLGLGVDRMAEYAKALGYGQLTGIELPGEATGLVPTSAWKRINLSENWSIGDTYIAAMGQGFVLINASTGFGICCHCCE